MNIRCLRIIMMNVLFLALCSCNKDNGLDKEDEGGGEVTPPGIESLIQGLAQKGDFVKDTTVTIRFLNDNLEPVGENLQGQVTDDCGAFSIDKKENNYPFAEIIVDGYYFNEVSNKVSESAITLRNLVNLSEKQNANVNLLTTLESYRTRALMSGTMNSSTARKQAEKEILELFHISDSTGIFTTMSTNKTGDANAILLSTSVTLQADRSTMQLSSLITQIAAEIQKDGKITTVALSDSIRSGAMRSKPEQIEENIADRYAAVGVKDYTIPDFDGFIDNDGNEVCKIRVK